MEGVQTGPHKATCCEKHKRRNQPRESEERFDEEQGLRRPEASRAERAVGPRPAKGGDGPPGLGSGCGERDCGGCGKTVRGELRARRGPAEPPGGEREPRPCWGSVRKGRQHGGGKGEKGRGTPPFALPPPGAPREAGPTGGNTH